MNGPEHYAAGERILENVKDHARRIDGEPTPVDQMMAQQASWQTDLAFAQAHFLAAQVAATLLTNPAGAVNDGWAEVVLP